MLSATYAGELTGQLQHRCLLVKVRRKPRFRVTPVARYVATHRAAVVRGVRATLEEWAHKLARILRETAERAGMGKALDPAEQLMRDVLEALDIEGMSKDIADELYPAMRKAFKKSSAASSKEILGKTPTELVRQLDEKALRYARKRAAELVGATGGEWSISEATKDGLRKVVGRAVQEGWSPSVLQREIEESYPFSAGRAEIIARTELAFAHVQGNVEGWRVTGKVEGKRSLLGDLHDHDDECDDNAEAGVVDLEDSFPSGDKFPPYHPNCVCDVVPVLEGEEE